MSFYILAENPDITAKEALQRSMKMMKGNKFKLFTLQLSFIWWYLLCAVTLGAAGIYVIPYVNAAHAIFYCQLVAEDSSAIAEEIPAVV